MSTSIIPHIDLETETLSGGELDVIKLEGKETISQLFHYEILAVCRDPSQVEPEELVGQEAALVYSRDGVTLGRVYGMISVVNDRLETETAYSTYRLTFVPRAYRLTLVETLDAFIDINVPDAIRQKLNDAGFREKGQGEQPAEGGSAAMPLGQAKASFDYEMRLYDTYPVRDFIVQYQETDLAFVSRLCEHLGISFFFEHQSGKDVLVFTDVNEGFRPAEGGPTAPFRARGEHTDVYSFEETIRMIPSQYVIRDYNYRTPQVTLTGQAQVPTGLGSVVEYGSHVKTPDEAEKLAHVRAQERMAQRRIYEGKSDVPLLTAGSRLTVLGHPRGDTKLLLTEVSIGAEQVTLGVASVRESFFSADFKAISETRRYRPPRLTPKPRIHGVVNGVVDSAKSDTKYADVDEHGRYRVRFLFDTTGPDKGQASKLVRMAQPHAGEGYGMHFPLRPGVEVIITFMDGDPDRPIIAATVPNPQQASPIASNNSPRNIIRTGAGNEINIDDTEDSTRIKMSVPHKNTVFQLGAPNSPERGAMLETQGAYSSVTLDGSNTFTSLKASLSAIQDFRTGGCIHTVAEVPDFFEKVGSVAEIMASLTEIASAVVETAVAAREAYVASLKQQSIDAQVAARTAKESADEANEKASGSELPLALYGLDDYAAAKAKIDAQYSDHSSPGYQAAMAALLKKPGMLSAEQVTDYNALPKGADGKVDKTSAQYKAWYEAQKANYTDAEGNVDTGKLDARVAELDDSAASTKALHDSYAAQQRAASSRFNPAPATYPATSAAYVALYRSQNASTPLSDEEITALYEQDAAARSAAETAEKMKGVQEAQEAYDEEVANLRATEEFLRDNKMSGEYVARNPYEIEARENAIAASNKKLYGDPTTTPPTPGLLDTLNTAKQNLGIGTDSSGKPTSTPLTTEMTADEQAQLAAYQANLVAAQRANDASDASWDAADQAKKTYDTELEDAEHGDDAQNLKEAQVVLSQSKNALVLFSDLIKIIALAKTLYHRYKDAKPKKVTFWNKVKEAVTLSFDKYAKDRVDSSGNIIKGFVKHTLGSEWDTEVFAKNELHLKSEGIAKLDADKELAIAADTLLSVTSKEKLEISGKELKLTSLAGGGLEANVDELKLVVKEKAAEITAAKDKLSLTAEKKDLELSAAEGDVTIDAHKKDVKLTAAQTASLLAGSWGITAKATGELTVGDPSWQLSIKTGEVALGSAGAAAHLQLKAGEATLQTSGTLTLKGKPVKIDADTVNFGPATIQSDNLMVKGSLNPALAAMVSLVKSTQAVNDANAKEAQVLASTNAKKKAALRAARATVRQTALEAAEALNQANTVLRALQDAANAK